MNPDNTLTSESYTIRNNDTLKTQLMSQTYKAVISTQANMVYSFGMVFSDNIPNTFLNTTELAIINVKPCRNAFEMSADETSVFFLTSESTAQLIHFDISSQTVKKITSLDNMKCKGASTIIMSDNSTLFFSALFINGYYGVLCKHKIDSYTSFV